MLRKCLVLFMLFSLLVPALTAQEPAEPEQPLLEMLAYIPLSFAGNSVSYQDFRAVENAVPYIQRPEGDAYFDENAPRDYVLRWRSVPLGVSSWYDTAPLLEEVVGFRARDLNRTLDVRPSDSISVWAGDIDAEAVIAAHEARDYVATQQDDGTTILCYQGDCSRGEERDEALKVAGNIFSPNQGNKGSLWVQDGLIVYTLFEDALTTSVGGGPSLLDAPNIRALAEAASVAGGDLVNWQYIRLDFPQKSFDLSAEPPVAGSTFEDPNDVLPEVLVGYNAIAPYTGFAVADRQEGDQQATLMLLSYDNADDAAFAAEEIAGRTQRYVRILANEPFIDELPLMTRIEATAVSQRVFEATNGVFVAVIQVDVPTPTEEQLRADFTSPDYRGLDGGMFGWVIAMIFDQTFYPLWLGEGPE